MRPLEWLLFLSFAPALLSPLLPMSWRRWITVSALMPVIVCGVHLIAEGWRVQMLPVYGLAVLVPVFRLTALWGRESVIRRRRGGLVSAVLALLLLGCGVLAGWLLPVATLPEPTGPYAVGIVDRELIDQSRDRRLMVSIWYPAAESGTPAPLTHHPDEVAAGLEQLTGLPAPTYQHLRYIRLSASEDVPVLAQEDPFPVLVFSHGLVGLRLQNSSTMQELASWGYVVVAVDHTDAAAVTVFPDGTARYFDLAQFGVPADVEPDQNLMNEYVFPTWVADQRFVYDSLESWAAADALLAGKLDLTRIGSFGHSFGGATALEVCRVDARCGAAVNLDGGLYGELASLPAVHPLMLMTSEGSVFPETVAEWTQMIDSATTDAYWLELPDSRHLSFTFMQLLSPLLVPPDFDPRAGLRTIDRYLRAFFERHLTGVATSLLDPASGETDVRWVSP